MKTIQIYLTILFVLIPVMVLAAPAALPVAKVFEFAPVPEGEKLTHEFIIKNQGDESLKIVDVIPP